MDHATPLITTIVMGLGLALIFGAIANRLRISPLVGYLLAGVVVGPYTPGYIADADLAFELAEIGVILLMFGVGLHFSLKDLLAVKNIAVPGAIVQISLASAMGMGLAHFLGWSLAAGIVFGLSLSVASTVVLLRAMQDRHLIETEKGRIAVGWLIVEDLVMVLTIVMLPALAGFASAGEPDPVAGATAALTAPDNSAIFMTLLVTIGKVAAFVALMLVIGSRVIPWVLHMMAQSGSRELFRLGVLAIALGTAYAAASLFGASFALGAFFAGMILSGSPLSHRAAEETLPLRDAFAVLFFVSVGMLFNPAVVVEHPLPIVATLVIIMLGKSIGAYFIVRAFGYSNRTALIISASLAQIGEFSFILAGMGLKLNLLPADGNDYILAGAIISIMLNPAVFALIDRFKEKRTVEEHHASAQAVPTPNTNDNENTPAAPTTPPAPEAEPQIREDLSAVQARGHADDSGNLIKTNLNNHAIIVGYGRVGQLVCKVLERERWPYMVIEDNHRQYEEAVARGIETIPGNGVENEILEASNIQGARWLFVAIPDIFEAGQIVSKAHAANPALTIIARAHTNAEAKHLYDYGASVVIRGQDEIARGMVSEAFSDPSVGMRSSKLPMDADDLREVL